MKKAILLFTVSLFLTAGWAVAQTASLSFNDNVGAPTSGTYLSTDTITFDVLMTWTGTSTGLSYWLETETGVASALSLTNEAYFVFPVAQDGEAKPWNFTDTSGQTNSGFLTDQSATQSGDLGGTNTTAQAAATDAKVSTLTFSLTGAAPGTYTISMTTAIPKVSEATVDLSDAFFAKTAANTYTFTVVPEPATWSLIGLGGLGALGMNLLRARRKS